MPIYKFDVVVTRSYAVYVEANDQEQAEEAFYSGDIQTSGIHEFGSLNHVELDVVEYRGRVDMDAMFDVRNTESENN